MHYLHCTNTTFRQKAAAHSEAEKKISGGVPQALKDLVSQERATFEENNLFYPTNISGTLYGSWEYNNAQIMKPSAVIGGMDTGSNLGVTIVRPHLNNQGIKLFIYLLVYLFTCLLIYLFICLHVYLFTCLLIDLFTCLLIDLFTY